MVKHSGRNLYNLGTWEAGGNKITSSRPASLGNKFKASKAV